MSAGSTSVYEYCGGNPISFIDSSGLDEDPVKGVSYSGPGDAGGVSRQAPYTVPPPPPKVGGLSAPYSPKPAKPPDPKPEEVSSSAKTPAPPTPWELQIEEMNRQDQMPAVWQGYYDHGMEVTKDERRAAALARAYPAFKGRIEAKQREEFFLKAAPFMLPGAPEVALESLEVRAAAGMELSLGTKAATPLETAAPRILTAEEELAGPIVQSGSTTVVHEVSTTNAQVQTLANAADQPVIWMAGDEVMLGTHQQAMATNPTTWYATPADAASGAVGYRNAMGTIPISTPSGSAPLMPGLEFHHFSYPRTAYPGLVMDSENIFIMFPSTHAQIHSAFGGTRAMGWSGIQGAETPIRNMFNFWIPKGRQ